MTTDCGWLTLSRLELSSDDVDTRASRESDDSRSEERMDARSLEQIMQSMCVPPSTSASVSEVG